MTRLFAGKDVYFYDILVGNNYHGARGSLVGSGVHYCGTLDCRLVSQGDEPEPVHKSPLLPQQPEACKVSFRSIFHSQFNIFVFSRAPSACTCFVDAPRRNPLKMTAPSMMSVSPTMLDTTSFSAAPTTQAQQNQTSVQSPTTAPSGPTPIGKLQ